MSKPSTVKRRLLPAGKPHPPSPDGSIWPLTVTGTKGQQVLTQASSGVALQVESLCKRNLLVPSADEVAEPRNRRVEITLR